MPACTCTYLPNGSLLCNHNPIPISFTPSARNKGNNTVDRSQNRSGFVVRIPLASRTLPPPSLFLPLPHPYYSLVSSGLPLQESSSTQRPLTPREKASVRTKYPSRFPSALVCNMPCVLLPKMCLSFVFVMPALVRRSKPYPN